MKITGLTKDGIGLAEDGSLWPRTLPGEEIDAEGRILTPSPDRVFAPCRHAKACGGCGLQHASDDFVAGWKADVVRRALTARGIAAEISDVHTSPPQTRRRAKLSGRRTKAGAIVGFHGKASGTIVEVPDCRVLTPALRDLAPVLAQITRRVGSRKGEVSLTVADTQNGPDVAIEGAQAKLDLELARDLSDLATAAGLSRVTLNGEVVLTRADPVQAMGRASVAPPPGAFLQATRDGEAALVAEVRRILKGASTVVDLFAGCGTFTLPLAEMAEVHAVEGSAEMLAALDKGWRVAPGLRRVTTEARDLFRRPLIPDELKQEGAVIDPPRAGAAAQVAELCESDLRVIAMVSCNPVTFARDAQALIAAGFGMGTVTIVDQFRWSSHVELVAGFTRS